MIEQCVLLFCGITPLGMHLYRLVGAFPDCEPLLVVNDVDPSLLNNPSLLNFEVVRRSFQVPRGCIGVGKRCDWQGDLTDGFEVVHLLKQMTELEVGVHPALLQFIPSSVPLLIDGPESPAPIQEPIGGMPEPEPAAPEPEPVQEDLQAPADQSTVIDSQASSVEEKKDEPVEPVHADQLPAGEPQGDGAADTSGDKPRAITVGKGSKR